MFGSPPERQERSGWSRRFARHPVATIGLVLAVSLLLCLGTVEILLRVFSGLGTPPLYDLSPLYGYRLKARQVINLQGGVGFLYGAKLTTNNLGLRAARDWDAERRGKILFLGDSVTYGGQYVADDELFSSIVESRLSGWQVGNGASNAWGIENIVGLVMDSGFSPAEVIVTCLIEGDFYRGLTRAPSLPLWTESPRFALENLLMHFIWRANEWRYGGSVDPGEQSEDQLERIVDRAARRLRDLERHLVQEQVRHFIFILPTRDQVVQGGAPDSRVEEALKRYDMEEEYLLRKLLIQEPNVEERRAWYRDEVHLAPSGHHAYGVVIGESLSGALAGSR